MTRDELIKRLEEITGNVPVVFETDTDPDTSYGIDAVEHHLGFVRLRSEG
jgi:hypothetical protein